MARLIGGDDVDAGLILLPLLDQIGQRFSFGRTSARRRKCSSVCIKVPVWIAGEAVQLQIRLILHSFYKPILPGNCGSITCAMQNTNDNHRSLGRKIIDGVWVMKYDAQSCPRCSRLAPIRGVSSSTWNACSMAVRKRVATVSDASLAIYAHISPRSASAASVRRKVCARLIAFSHVRQCRQH
jgi:hypothetical protein